MRLIVLPALVASCCQRRSSVNNACASGPSFFSGWRVRPGTRPATNQLRKLSSTTATIVLAWSKATRDRLKSFRFMGRSIGGSIQQRWCHTLRRRPIASLWGAPRIHGELLKLGFEVAQSSVAKHMVKRRGPPSQGWLTFVVPTIGFDLLYAFVIVRIDRRELVWINVTKTATAEWVARQVTEAFPWYGAPGYMIRDRDRIYGDGQAY